ncbi:hypothetical protein VTI74DRAFT_5464 [Chaetomium olivicolor]
MAQNSSCVSAAGTARATAACIAPRPALPPSALQLFLKYRRRQLRKSTSPDSDSSTTSSHSESLDSNFTTSSLRKVGISHLNLASNSQSAPSLNHFPPTSKEVKFRDIAHALALHHQLRALAASKLAKLYRRHRNPERAVNLFLLRRLLWRSTRRPVSNMDWIEHLRMLQTDEPSSDEESGAHLTAATVPVRRLSPASANSASTPAQPARELEVTGAKRKRTPTAEDSAAMVGVAEGAPVMKKAKAPSPPTSTDGKPPPNVGRLPAPQTNGTEGAKKRKLDTPGADEEQQLAAKKIRPENGKALKPAATTAESSKDAPAPAKPNSGKGASASRAPSKPVHTMEYFEWRAHDMLTDPLGFDDCVHDTKKPFPRQAARGFAQCRRRQRQPTPPLEMRGALGPTQVARPAKVKVNGPRSLAKEAQKRAHQQKVDEQAQALKGDGKGFGGVKHEGMARANGVNGKGKHKERVWLTASPQHGNVHKHGGKKRPTSLGKYNKSTYVDVPVMSGGMTGKVPTTNTSETPPCTITHATTRDPPRSSSHVRRCCLFHEQCHRRHR